ncbi:MarR family winged helix-turn-helix transcriptional regulator [Nocardioides sp.]|uniref:MarR family winged helix-turn-helix transcriptional regulator n=1 Tax=Nocardioides sp. TaxID=35761 RepID=UPI0039E2F256
MSSKAVTRADAGLASTLRVAVLRLRRRLVNEHAPDNDLSIGSMAVLGALAKGGEATIGELAAHERVQPPSMTRIVGCLADGGYVERRASDTDRRQVIVAITEKGRATLEADKRRREEWLARRLAALTPQERAILRAAAPVLEKLATSE